MTNAKITPVHQKQYQSSVITLLARNKGGKLKQRCQTQNCKGNESTFFNTVGGTTISRTGNFLAGNFTDATSGAVKGAENVSYQLQRIEVTPKPIYAGNFVHETHYDKTMVNLDQVITEVQMDALGVEEDKEVLLAIGRRMATAAARPVPAANYYGKKAEALTLENFVTAMEIARLMLGTGERLTIIADKAAIAKLRTANEFAGLSAEMQSYFGVQTPGNENIATGNIVTWRQDLLDAALADATGAALTDTATVGRIIIMVEKAVGVANWNDTVEAGIHYQSQQSEYLLKAKIDIGCEVLDPQGIFVIEYLK
ncbi:MAG: hypothetical protein ACRC5T_11315 [Cetobacterium sp.]